MSVYDGAQPADAAPPAADATLPPATQFAELWYSVADTLVYIKLSESDGTVVGFTGAAMPGKALGHNSLTMLDDGSLLGARLSQADDLTYFYHIENPPRDGSDVVSTELGAMPKGIMLEALYTDCDGRLYGMDTGVNDTSAQGNRLLRFAGNVLSGDLQYVVVSDLSSAVVADIDDMAPGISDNEITDNPGFAIDTGAVYDFAYDTGTGVQKGSGGSFGIHALGGSLFDDELARLYVFSEAGELFEMSTSDFSLSAVLGTGPSVSEGQPGWSGLAGPLTDCDSGFEVD
tara:strand:- start:75637 stop:76500 length:864 start_codon:yes stop_codon:yes gene_type:complete